MPARTIKSWLSDTSETLRPRLRGWQKSIATSFWAGRRDHGYCGNEQDASRSLKRPSLLELKEGKLAETFAFHAVLKGDEYPVQEEVDQDQDVVEQPHQDYSAVGHTAQEEDWVAGQDFSQDFGMEAEQYESSLSPGATTGTPRTRESSTRRPVEPTDESMGFKLNTAFAEADSGLSKNAQDASLEEQYTSESGWHPRTRKFAEALAEKFDQSDSPENPSVKLNEFVAGANRKTVAASFFETLVLKSLDVIDVDQQQSYEDIYIKKTVTFDQSLRSNN